MISADPPERSKDFKVGRRVDFTFLSDVDHAVADIYNIPIQRSHPMSHTYKDGFIQPAIFAYKGEEAIFEFIQTPKASNVWGASGRPSPKQVLKNIRKKL
jgi:peroxiredoxin